nr:hypothetical protein [Tanacetum cinerariifolium]
MSSSDSTVTYTSISSEDVPFWGIRFFGMEQPDSPEAAPQSPIKTPPVPYDEDECEPMFIQPHDLDYMPEPMYPEYILLEDEYVLPAEEQPLPPDLLLFHLLLSHQEDDESEDDESEDDESEDGLVDYLMDGGDDGDDDDGDLFRDDADDEDEEEEDEEEEEEKHLASADSAVVIPTVELVSPPERTEPASISLPPEAEVERLLAMPTPPSSPLTTLSPPSVGERLARDDIPETELLPRKKSCLFALGPRYEVGESSTARPTGGRGIDYGFFSTLDVEARRRGIREVVYGIRDTWVDSVEVVPEITPMTLGEVNTRVTELVELHEHDTHDLYALLEDAQDSRTLISQRVTMDSQRVNLLTVDRIAHQETILIVEKEAYAS